MGQFPGALKPSIIMNCNCICTVFFFFSSDCISIYTIYLYNNSVSSFLMQGISPTPPPKIERSFMGL